MALVVFLRGCNVGGQRRMRPTVLAQQLRQHEVVNIGAAGTFVVRKPTTRAKLIADLRSRLPFDADIMICEGREFISAVAAAPVPKGRTGSDTVRFMSIFAKRPRVRPQLPLGIPAKGAWVVKLLGIENRFLFGLYRRQMKTIGYLDEIDTLFGARATTRNWNTISAILKILRSKDS